MIYIYTIDMIRIPFHVNILLWLVLSQRLLSHFVCTLLMCTLLAYHTLVPLACYAFFSRPTNYSIPSHCT